MAGFTSVDPCYGTLLSGTSTLQCAGGIVGGSAGTAWDTELFGVYIVLNAAAAALTVGGLYDSSGTAQSLLITGETTVDYFWMPPSPILNSKAAFTFTPSIAGKIWVYLRCYNGPERPGTRATT